MIPRLVWREKHVPKEGNAVADNSVDAPAGSVDAVTSYSEDAAHNPKDGGNNSEDDGKYSDDDIADDMANGVNSENGNNTFTDMDINMVFALPAEFRAPESEVAELVLGRVRLCLRNQRSPTST